MKYKVKDGNKRSPWIPAKKVLSLYHKALIGVDARVTDRKGRSVTIERFAVMASEASIFTSDPAVSESMSDEPNIDEGWDYDDFVEEGNFLGEEHSNPLPSIPARKRRKKLPPEVDHKPIESSDSKRSFLPLFITGVICLVGGIAGTVLLNTNSTDSDVAMLEQAVRPMSKLEISSSMLGFEQRSQDVWTNEKTFLIFGGNENDLDFAVLLQRTDKPNITSSVKLTRLLFEVTEQLAQDVSKGMSELSARPSNRIIEVASTPQRRLVTAAVMNKRVLLIGAVSADYIRRHGDDYGGDFVKQAILTMGEAL